VLARLMTLESHVACPWKPASLPRPRLEVSATCVCCVQSAYQYGPSSAQRAGAGGHGIGQWVCGDGRVVGHGWGVLLRRHAVGIRQGRRRGEKKQDGKHGECVEVRPGVSEG
jgi:hypothetical protein